MVDYSCGGLDDAEGVCPEDKIPILAPANHEIWRLFLMMMPGLVTDIGFNYSVIETVCNVEGIEGERRKEVFQKALKLINVIAKERRPRTENEGGKLGPQFG